MKEHRIVGILAAALIMLCATGIAKAQTGTRVTACNAATPNNAICLEWAFSGKNVDGTSALNPTFRVEQRIGTTGAWTNVVTGITDLKRYITGLSPGTYFYRVYAMCGAPGCIESDASNVASRSATAPTQQPEAPIITIAVVIGVDHSPVYRLTQAGKKDERYSDACGYIPVGKTCSGTIVFRFRDKSFRRVSASDVKPWVDCGANVAGPCG